MTIAAILQGQNREVVHLESTATVQQAAQLLSDYRIGCLPVVDGSKVVGIISERDIVRLLAQSGLNLLDQPVSTVMTSPALTISPNIAVMSALSLMTQRRIRHLPVVEGSKMIGFVSIGDLVKYRIDRMEAEASAMREYIQSA